MMVTSDKVSVQRYSHIIQRGFVYFSRLVYSLQLFNTRVVQGTTMSTSSHADKMKSVISSP